MKTKTSLVFIMIVIAYGIFSCKEKERDVPQIEILSVDLSQIKSKGNFDDYFSSSEIIPLETTSESIISSIDRISIYNNIIFVLDGSLNSVFIFDFKGKYLRKIYNVGRGPYEYDSLMDFAIDEKSNYLVLYCDRPYKLLVYKTDGQFLFEKRLSNLYSNIAAKSESVLLLNRDSDRDYMFYDFKFGDLTKNKFVETKKRDRLFEKFKLPYPNIVTDEKIRISFPYSEIIYEYDNHTVKPKYLVDFGSNKLPDNVFDRGMDFIELFDYAEDNGYGFGISNFRENNNYITFSFGVQNLVIYSKKEKKANIFKLFMSSRDQIPFFNYFAHDGNDNKLISVYQAGLFKSQMEIYKNEGEPWERIPDYIKNITHDIDERDNPILVIYNFKE